MTEPELEDIDTDRCERCGELISTSVQTCPKCGNEPAKTGKWAGIGLMVGGILLSITVFGAIVGIPLFVIGLAVTWGGRTLKPTDHDFGGD